MLLKSISQSYGCGIFYKVSFIIVVGIKHSIFVVDVELQTTAQLYSNQDTYTQIPTSKSKYSIVLFIHIHTTHLGTYACCAVRTGTEEEATMFIDEMKKKYWKEKMYIRIYPRDLDPCIHGIQVDTSKQVIEVNISLRYPGELIGKGGEIIDRVSEKLSEEFGIETRINLKEIIEDPNQNLY